MTAKEYLSQYREAVKDIRCRQAEIEQLREDATAISPSASADHTAGNISDKVGRKAPEIADLEREIEEEKAAARLLRRDIRRTIGAVSGNEMRRLLTYRYLCGFTFERIAVKMGKSYYHVVHRMHPHALRLVGDTDFEKNKKCY